ncbi:hypothetical protein HYALB_00001967 [Hymenoscyphus albidus]|uniref:Uncharacterized protein n=1 Tax=Hymenoscyphus albidus TaxID=595503 RepID=A0A9N9LHX8_9HELO|nr:hypothetical protein HYALB_00001967 [Hymenoscyphus albidus]
MQLFNFSTGTLLLSFAFALQALPVQPEARGALEARGGPVPIPPALLRSMMTRLDKTHRGQKNWELLKHQRLTEIIGVRKPPMKDRAKEQFFKPSTLDIQRSPNHAPTTYDAVLSGMTTLSSSKTPKSNQKWFLGDTDGLTLNGRTRS